MISCAIFNRRITSLNDYLSLKYPPDGWWVSGAESLTKYKHEWSCLVAVGGSSLSLSLDHSHSLHNFNLNTRRVHLTLIRFHHPHITVLHGSHPHPRAVRWYFSLTFHKFYLSYLIAVESSSIAQMKTRWSESEVSERFESSLSTLFAVIAHMQCLFEMIKNALKMWNEKLPASGAEHELPH